VLKTVRRGHPGKSSTTISPSPEFFEAASLEEGEGLPGQYPFHRKMQTSEVFHALACNLKLFEIIIKGITIEMV